MFSIWGSRKHRKLSNMRQGIHGGIIRAEKLTRNLCQKTLTLSGHDERFIVTSVPDVKIDGWHFDVRSKRKSAHCIPMQDLGYK